MNTQQTFIFATRVNAARMAAKARRRVLLRMRVEAKRVRELETMQRAARFAC